MIHVLLSQTKWAAASTFKSTGVGEQDLITALSHCLQAPSAQWAIPHRGTISAGGIKTSQVYKSLYIKIK